MGLGAVQLDEVALLALHGDLVGPHGEKGEQLAEAALGWWVGNYWVKAVLLLSELF